MNYKVKFKNIKLSLASPEKLLSLSYGEVLNEGMFNDLTGKPLENGLFCPKIFGPNKEFECLCDTPTPHVGYCKVCNVDLKPSINKRRRFGHIELASRVVHPWFYRVTPSVIADLLDIRPESINNIVNYNANIDIKTKRVYTRSKNVFVDDISDIYTGAEAILALLSKLNLKKERDNLLNKSCLTENSTRRLELITSFIESNVNPVWMVLELILVLPSGLRPVVSIEDNKMTTSDLNELYKRVIQINNKLIDYKLKKAHVSVLIHTKKMLQYSIEALLDNDKLEVPLVGYNNCALKSLSELLKGKKGRFRHTLLGKRVDYSGRTVIVPGPCLKLDECGLPYEMAIELFKPFVYAKLLLCNIANSLKQAKHIINENSKIVKTFLLQAMSSRIVLLNRAPTLHKLSMQAFRVKLNYTKVIQLHPLVCTAYNADFDGDQMAVHLPLSVEAQLEAQNLLISKRNILHPANGSPIILPSQDMILGLYYLSIISNNSSEIKFASEIEIRSALRSKIISLHTKILFYENNEGHNKLFKTTAGRMFISEIIPKEAGIRYDNSYPEFNKEFIKNLANHLLKCVGKTKLVSFCVNAMKLGFKYACKCGISLGKRDLISVPNKIKIIKSTIQQVNELAYQFDYSFSKGINEKFNEYKLILKKIWNNMLISISNNVETIMNNNDINSTLKLMILSGARGSILQLAQLVGIKGKVLGFNSLPLDQPIMSCLTQGLSCTELFLSTYGARKALVDSVLKTSSSGYLTRKLVEVTQNYVVHIFDCGTCDGLTISTNTDTDSLKNNLLGRTLLKTIKAGNTLIKSGNQITDLDIYHIVKANISSVQIRTAITCALNEGVCALCYGINLCTNKLVQIGEAVGILAAQAVGEPGTQLTLRSFHKTAINENDIQDTHINLAKYDGMIKIDNLAFAINAENEFVILNNLTTLSIINNNLVLYKVVLKIGYILCVKHGQYVKRNNILFLTNLNGGNVICLIHGKTIFNDLIDQVNLNTGLIAANVSKTTNLTPAWLNFTPTVIILSNKIKFFYKIKNNENSMIPIKVYLHIADSFHDFKTSCLQNENKAQVEGLSKISNLFENKCEDDEATLVPVSGHIKYGDVSPGGTSCILIPIDKKLLPFEFYFEPNTNIKNGKFFKAGVALTDGEPGLTSLLFNGLTKLVHYFINKMQTIYKSQGIEINCKHIEIILKQMLNVVEIVNVSNNYNGNNLEKLNVIYYKNKLLNGKKHQLIKFKPLVLGISELCLRQTSILSACSFQDSVKVLTSMLRYINVEKFIGVKERMMAGKIVPMGTGYFCDTVNKWPQ